MSDLFVMFHHESKVMFTVLWMLLMFYVSCLDVQCHVSVSKMLSPSVSNCVCVACVQALSCSRRRCAVFDYVL